MRSINQHKKFTNRKANDVDSFRKTADFQNRSGDKHCFRYDKDRLRSLWRAGKQRQYLENERNDRKWRNPSATTVTAVTVA